MNQETISCAALSELDEVALSSIDGGVLLEAMALGMAMTYGVFEAYQWGYDYAKARM